MAGWLAGFRVLDLTDERGLLAGQMLAKLGADVIQVEPPAGSTARSVPPFDAEGRSFYWSAYAAGKRGIVLDMEQAEGRALVEALAAQADFLIESADPGRMDALGFSYDALARSNPRLIYVSITAFGSDGPKAGYAASDLIVWASAGPLHPSRDGDGPPLRISVPQAFHHAAADAATGALLAHFARVRSGLGQHVDISAQQSVTQATLGAHLSAAVGHDGFNPLNPSATRQPGAKPTLDLSGSGARTRRSKWQVKDGLVEMHLAMGPAAGGRANNLMTWMKAEGSWPEPYSDWDWIKVPQLILTGTLTDDDLEAVRTAVAAFLARFTKAELQAEALNRKILLAPVNEVTDLLESPHLAARGFFATVDEGEETRTIPWAFAQGCAGMFADPRGAPTLGEHGDAVLGGLLGLGSAELSGLRARGVI